VQGYYFSKPVPAEDFDRFLAERIEVEDKIHPEARKTYMSISQALTTASQFERIYYVDVVTNSYLEFVMEKGNDSQENDLQIRSGGKDFFVEVRDKLLQNVCDEDAPRVKEALGKNHLIQQAEQDEMFSLTFRKVKDPGQVSGELIPYTLQTIKTRESDTSHIVLGITQEAAE